MEIHPEFLNGFMHGFGEKLAFLLLSCIGYLCWRKREQILRSVGKIFRCLMALMKYVLLVMLAGVILWGGYEGYKHWMPSGSPTHEPPDLAPKAAPMVKPPVPAQLEAVPSLPKTVEPQREDAQTQYQRGREYDEAKNYAEAVKWYRLAAERGSTEAQCALGVMYYNGCGVKRDYKEALKWLHLAAEKDTFRHNTI